MLALALQAGLHDVQVFSMTEAHDQHPAAWHQVCHRRLHGVGMLAVHMGRHLGRKNLVAAVHPAHVERQRGEDAHQRLAHMTTTEQRHGCASGPQPIPQIVS